MVQKRVFMVAEKPSLARAIAEALSEGRATSNEKTGMATYTWEGALSGSSVCFAMTSVIGHVFNVDFPSAYQSWQVDPSELFWVDVKRSEANPKARVVRHLECEARGADELVLWLDCDREGENICFEVIDCVCVMRRARSLDRRIARLNSLLALLARSFGRKSKLKPGAPIRRARFSALSSSEIRRAMDNLGIPNLNESLSVDARQELDLKLGVAFSRFQSRYLQEKYSNLSDSVISFGPCLTPTLNFVVQRHDLITQFKPEPFWTIKVVVTSPSGAPLALEWKRGRIFDEEVSHFFRSTIGEHARLKVVDVAEKVDRRSSPNALNTVGLLKACSSQLGIGPADAMRIAESLYLRGYLSYPRTESTAFPPGFEFDSILRAQCRNDYWGEYASSLMTSGTFDPSQVKGGVDAGDHPPLTPVRPASDELGGWDMMVYDLVTRYVWNLCGWCSPPTPH